MLVKGSNSQTPHGQQALSGFDIKTQHSMFPMTFFYQRTISEKTMIESLRSALDLYPQFSGRLDSEDGEATTITLNNKGAYLSAQSYPSDIPETDEYTSLSGSEEYLCQPIYAGSFNGETPVLQIKLSNFNNGSILSVTCSHKLCDGTAFIRFIADWAALYNGRQPKHPDHDRSILKRRSSLTSRLEELFCRSKPEAQSGIPETKYFYIENQVLEDTLTERNKLGNHSQWISKQDLLAAILWKSTITTRDVAADEKEHLIGIYDIRKILGLPEGFIGNAVTYQLITKPREKMQKLEITSIAETLRAHAGTLNLESCLADNQFWIKMVEKQKPARFAYSPMEDHCLRINNYSKFAWHEVDFGGSPAWFGFPTYAILNRWLFILPSIKKDHGFRIQVNLEPEKMLEFQENISRYSRPASKNHDYA